MKIYICPECGQFREASRRKEVICYRCENEVQNAAHQIVDGRIF